MNLLIVYQLLHLLNESWGKTMFPLRNRRQRKPEIIFLIPCLSLKLFFFTNRHYSKQEKYSINNQTQLQYYRELRRR